MTSEDSQSHVMDDVQFKIRVAREHGLNPRLSPSEIIARIDLISYTVTFDVEEYIHGVRTTMNEMKAKNYTLAGGGFRNFWANGTKNYKGINVTWRDPDTGQCFELRLHTTESFQAEQAAREIYDAWRALDSVKHAAQIRKLEARAKALWDSVVEPPGVRAFAYPLEITE